MASKLIVPLAFPRWFSPAARGKESRRRECAKELLRLIKGFQEKLKTELRGTTEEPGSPRVSNETRFSSRVRLAFDDQRSPSWATSSTSDRLFRSDSPRSPRLCSLPAMPLTIFQQRDRSGRKKGEKKNELSSTFTRDSRHVTGSDLCD